MINVAIAAYGSSGTENVRLDLSYCETHPGFVPDEYVQLADCDTGMGYVPKARRSLMHE